MRISSWDFVFHTEIHVDDVAKSKIPECLRDEKRKLFRKKFELITSAYPNRTSVSELIAWGRTGVNCPAQNPDAGFDSHDASASLTGATELPATIL